MTKARQASNITIDVKSPSGSTAVHGLLAIDEEKLNALPAMEFEKLRKARALPAIYAQQISLGSTGSTYSLSSITALFIRPRSPPPAP